MKEIGGYFALECGREPFYHKEGIYLNLGRSALRYLIRALRIRRMHVPYYTCPSVHTAVEVEGCETIYYGLDEKFLPMVEFPARDFVLYNNYFGVLGENVAVLAKRYPNLIVDNAQAFYSKQKCRAAIYSPRKFFGLPDGGVLVGNDIPKCDLPRATSWQVSTHLLKRLDVDATFGYADFKNSSKYFRDAPVALMSNLTMAMMGNIDVGGSAAKRMANFSYLMKNLPTKFPLALAVDDVPMVYPYITNNANLREMLIRERIYIATYWPGVSYSSNKSEIVLPVPLDQRCGRTDMERISEIINR